MNTKTRKGTRRKLPPEAIRAALARSKGDVEEAARLLGARKNVLCGRIIHEGLEDLAVMPWRDLTRSRLIALLEANRWRIRWTARDLRCSPALVHELVKTWSIERPADATFDEGSLPLDGEAGEAHVTRRVRLSLSAYRALFALRGRLRKEVHGRRGAVGLGLAIERLLDSEATQLPAIA